MMDPRVKPAGDGGAPARVMAGLVPSKTRYYSSSWPGLSRPSTSFVIETSKQDVDARHKAGHDKSNPRRHCGARPAEDALSQLVMAVEDASSQLESAPPQRNFGLQLRESGTGPHAKL